MSRRPLPLNAIYSFLVTARHLNLTHAAQELCITQGAVSRKIAALEAWLGFHLFERHARGLRLTERGSALLPGLRSGFEQMEQAALQASGQNAPLRLRAPTCAMRWLLPRLVALEKAHPELHVALTTTLEHRRQLDNFDAAIVYGAPLAEGKQLFAERLTAVVAPGLISSARPDLTALNGQTFLHPTEDSGDWQRWLQQDDGKVTMSRNQHFATMDLAIGAAIQGFGVTVADVTLIAAELQQGSLLAPWPRRVETGAVYTLLLRPPERAHLQQALLTDALCQKEIQSSAAAEVAAGNPGRLSG